MQEIGFSNMGLTIMSNGMLDNIIHGCETYRAEKAAAEKLLDARYDIEHINDRSRDYIIRILSGEVRNWYKTTRYATQINTLREEIMDFAHAQLVQCGVEIISRGANCFRVGSISDIKYMLFKREIEKKWYRLEVYVDKNI